LHDIFILKSHKGGYNRELLRLLMDGHVLLLSSALMFISWRLVRAGISDGAVLSIVVAVGMLLYCAMIFPFLKSFGTIAITSMLAIASVGIYLRLS
jgi:hypothetical protein